ncbi:hypothetical protein CC79DRAFT_78132 [Sarocladium strictum]
MVGWADGDLRGTNLYMFDALGAALVRVHICLTLVPSVFFSKTMFLFNFSLFVALPLSFPLFFFFFLHNILMGDRYFERLCLVLISVLNRRRQSQRLPKQQGQDKSPVMKVYSYRELILAQSAQDPWFQRREGTVFGRHPACKAS